jgi:hypothetical protein
MINFRKGTGHSMQQSDFIGTAAGNDIVAGMLVQKNATGEIEKADTVTTAADNGLLGFAITNEDEGDAIESGKIGCISLDGNSVIETDQFTDGPYTAADVGKAVIVSATDGMVKAVAHGSVGTARILGTVYDAPRSIYVGWTATTVLPIKLGAGPTTLS